MERVGAYQPPRREYGMATPSNEITIDQNV